MVTMCILFLFAATQVFLVSGKGDFYTDEELLILPKFLDRIKSNLTQDYMFENKFLVRYLRARRLNLNAAEQMLLDTLKWRKEERIDVVLSEDFRWWTKRFPFYFPLDRDGRPGLASDTGVGNLNLRKYVLTSHVNDIRRYIYYVTERSLINLQKVSNESGVEYISGILLFNLAGYDNRIHACVSCLPYWFEIVRAYENHFPLLATTMIAVNAPRLYETAVSAVRPLVTLATQKSVRLYGYNKAEWSQEILKLFPPEQLTPEFGGTRKLPTT